MKKFFAFILTLFVFGVVASAGGAFFIFFKYGRGLPSFEQLAVYEPPVTSRLYAADGRLFAEYAFEKRIFVPIEAIPRRIIKTFLVAEDKNFYDHYGLDFVAIFRSALQNISRIRKGQRPIGASTITQQVARNFLLKDEASKVSLDRKIKEAILSFRIESAFSKEHILELYLNEIYLGVGSYGVAAAALNYFNKSLDALTIGEAAFLAGLPKAPSRYHPSRNPERAKARRDWVISRMVEEEMISPAQGETAKQEPLQLRKRDATEVVRADYFAEEVRRHLVKKYGEDRLYEGGLTVRTTLDPRLQEIADQALRTGLVNYDRTQGGWRGPVTHLGGETLGALSGQMWQDALSKVKSPPGLLTWSLAVVLKVDTQQAHIGLKDGRTGVILLKELKWARKRIDFETRGPQIKRPADVLSRGDVIMVSPVKDELESTAALEGKPTEYHLRQVPKVSGALVALNPHTGAVLAMSGGYDFGISQFNRATQALRQPGSAFKPFVYLAALEKGLTPSSIIVDEPIAIYIGHGQGIWKPHNYEKNFLGPLTLRQGLQKSRNIISIRTTYEKVGINAVVEVAKRFGVYDNMPPHLSAVLGTQELPPLKLAAAYARVANGGRDITPTLIDRIQNRKGKTIDAPFAKSKVCVGCSQEKWEGQMPPSFRDLRPQVGDARILYQLTNMLTGVVDYGTGRSIRRAIKDVPLAAKTGTSNDFKDAWVCGYSPDLVVCVFVGFDGPRGLGNHQGGARVAAPIFSQFMKKALKGKPAVPFRVPPGVRLVRVDASTGRPPEGKERKKIIYEAFLDDNMPKWEDASPSSSKSNDVNTKTDSRKQSAPTESINSTIGGLY